MEVFPADVQHWVSKFSQPMLDLLAKGPWQGDECRCCDTFDCFWDDEAGYSSRSVELLADFHHDDHEDEDSGLRSYLSCLYIYLCAGWDGIHGDE